jgi:hypothetical protein
VRLLEEGDARRCEEAPPLDDAGDESALRSFSQGQISSLSASLMGKGWGGWGRCVVVVGGGEWWLIISIWCGMMLMCLTMS